MAMLFTDGKGNVNVIHQWQGDGGSLAHCSFVLHYPPSLEPRSAPKGSHKKKLVKSGQADRLGRPPPLPRSGQENVKNLRQVVIFGVILPFYKGQNGSKFSQNRSGQAGGG